MGEMRRRTRVRYHAAVRQAKKMKNDIVKGRVAQSLFNKDSKLFWKNISKMNKKENLVSAVIDNKQGKDACYAFKEIYQNLFNSNPSSDLEIVNNDITDK